MINILIFVLLFCCSLYVSGGTPHNWKFEGKYLLSLSDADMVASAYVDGKLGEREGVDTLAVIQLNDRLPDSYKIAEVHASNSVAGPPLAIDFDKKGQFAYVIETFSARPSIGENHTFSDLKFGRTLSVYNLKAPNSPLALPLQKVGLRPDSISVHSAGNWLAIAYYPVNAEQAKNPLGLYKVEQGRIIEQFFPEIPGWKEGDRLIAAKWHPESNLLALINNSAAEVSFVKVNFHRKSMEAWGNIVSVGKSPFVGKFTEDGKHFIVNNLYWGGDVEGVWNEAPPGTIVNIKLNANGDYRNPRHALNSQVMVGASPEGFAVSPNGDWVVSLNMERSWLPYSDPRQNWFSSLSLIKRDPESGAMNVIHQLPFDGVLPEAAVFDRSGKYLAVATFDFYDESITGGAIDYFSIVEDPMNPIDKKLLKLRWYTPVTRGVHSLVLIE